MRKALLIIIALLMISGCEKKGTEAKRIFKDDNLIVEVAGEKFKLSSENNMQAMYYRENDVDFSTTTYANIHTIQYSKNNEFVFDIRLNYDSSRSLDEVKKQLKYDAKIKKVNDIEYTYYEYTTINGQFVHLYLYNYNNVTYTIMFVFNNDISDLENKFMNNVYFK